MTDPMCSAISRRRFLTGLGAAAATATVGRYAVTVFTREPLPGMTTTVPVATPTASTARAAGAPTNRTLVVVELGGGNDGLSMVVPHATDAYYDLRRQTAIVDPIDLDGFIGLHPNLSYLAESFRQGDLAIVEGVGYPDSDLSHFVSMATWWTASPGFDIHTGWLGRYLDATVGFDHPLAGITIGPGPSQAMAGAASFAVSIEDMSGLQPALPDWMDGADELLSSWAGMVPATVTDDLLGEAHRVIGQTQSARLNLNGRLAGQASGGRPRLADQFGLAAELITSGTPPQVLYVHGIGDFDTHENQTRRHGDMMADLDGAIGAFFGSLEAAGAADDVLVLTASEFGRRARDNGSGTDHGTASTHLLIGPAVSGGRYGEMPSLVRNDTAGNMTPTVDFRSVYASVLAEWLEVDPVEILGTGFEQLGMISM
ncbi:MAG: DUF1501 domain-containing protein [Acidimicrobiia bacterium]|nr:DUF1501 domain-containing protein [Acidimicrobiia bacterium]